MTLLPEYRAQLVDAAQSRAGRRPSRRVTSVVLTAASAVAAIAVAVLAITLLGGHERSPSVRAGQPEDGLVQILGVLRRPQTAADRRALLSPGDGAVVPGFLTLSGSAFCRSRARPASPCSIRPERSLFRAVDTGGGYSLAILPALAHERVGVVLTLRGPGLYLSSSGLPPVNSATIRARGLLLSTSVALGVDRAVLLVPDGVARVTLDDLSLTAPHHERLRGVGPLTAAVASNVASFTITGLTDRELAIDPGTLGRYFTEGSGRDCRVTYAVFGLPASARMTWSAASGVVVRRVALHLQLFVAVRNPPARSAAPFVCGRSTGGPSAARRRAGSPRR